VCTVGRDTHGELGKAGLRGWPAGVRESTRIATDPSNLLRIMPAEGGR